MKSGPVGGVSGSMGTIFFSSTYEETLSLVREARDYLSGRGREDVQQLDQAGSFAYATESLRLTTRLTESMAWLFYQRAIHEGEVRPEDVPPEELHLQHQDSCLTENSIHLELLPELLAVLMERSVLLYRRIERLDQMARQALQAGSGE